MSAPVQRLSAVPGTCPICSDNAADLVVHCRQTHKGHSFDQDTFAGTPIRVCQCNKIFPNATLLRSHVKTSCRHPDATPPSANPTPGPTDTQDAVEVDAALASSAENSADRSRVRRSPRIEDLPSVLSTGRNQSPASDAQPDNDSPYNSASEASDTDEQRPIDKATRRPGNRRADRRYSGQCPLCPGRHNKDLLTHLRRKHRGFPFTDAHAEATGFTRCPDCAVLLPLPSSLPIHRPRCPGAPTAQASTTNPARSAPRTAAAPQHGRPRPAQDPPLPESHPALAPFELPEDPLSSLGLLAPLYKPCPPSLAKEFVATAGRVAQAFVDDPSERKLLDILALPKLGLATGLRSGISKTAARLRAYPSVDWPEPDATVRVARDPVERATVQIEQGRFGAASRTLEDTTAVATITPEVIADLKAKHPVGPDDPFRHTFVTPPQQTAPPAEIFEKVIRSFRLDTAPGLSGWTVPLLKLACKSPAFTEFLRVLSCLITQNKAPGHGHLCASRLTPLLKRSGGIRPIAVGDLIYRTCAKAILRHNFKSDLLSPNQLGAGSRGGVEPGIRAVQQALEGKLGRSYRSLTLLDVANAFNNLCRMDIAEGVYDFARPLYGVAKWVYDRPADLFVRSGPDSFARIPSTQGVRQGDPLGPLFFSLGFRKLIDALQEFLGPECLVIAYLDDVIILGPGMDTLDRVHDFFARRAASTQLNSDKCAIHDLNDIREGGVELLGSCLGSLGARDDFLSRATTSIRPVLERLESLPRQHALLLLRVSVQQKLRHLMRSLPSDDLRHKWHSLDTLLRDALKRIRAARPAGNPRDDIEPSTAREDLLISLPIRLGGLGILSYEDCAPLAATAAAQLADSVLAGIDESVVVHPTPTTQRELCQALFLRQHEQLLTQLDTVDKVLVTEAGSRFGRKWLQVFPSNPHLRLTDAEVSAALHVRTLHKSSQASCHRCCKPNTTTHFEVCQHANAWFTARHEPLKYALGRMLATLPASSVEYEPRLAESPTRRHDVRFTGSPASGLASFDIDVSVVALGGTKAETFYKGRGQQSTDHSTNKETADRLANAWLAHHADKKRARAPQRGNELPFVPFIMSTGGLMEKSAAKALGEWREKVSDWSFEFMSRWVAVGLVKARHRTFAF